MSGDAEALAGAVGCVGFAGLVVVIGVATRKLGRLWPDTAKKLGLAFREGGEGSSFSSKSKDQKSIEGVISGVRLRAFQFSERSGNRTTSGTRVLGRALVPTQRQFAIHIERAGGGGAKFHVVDTGDAAFDRTLVLKSEKPDDVRALLDPTLRGALLWITREASLTYDRGELCLALGGTPSNTQELEALIRVVIAAASARLS